MNIKLPKVIDLFCGAGGTTKSEPPCRMRIRGALLTVCSKS